MGKDILMEDGAKAGKSRKAKAKTTKKQLPKTDVIHADQRADEVGRGETKTDVVGADQQVDEVDGGEDVPMEDRTGGRKVKAKTKKTNAPAVTKTATNQKRKRSPEVASADDPDKRANRNLK
jgi:hypothetical protein